MLFPGRSGEMTFDYAAMRAQENIGAFPLLPGAGGTRELDRFLGELLGRVSPEEHLACDIPTRGTSVVVGEAIGENEILDVDVPPGEWDDVMDKVKARSIDLPASVFKGRNPKSIRVLRFVCSNHPRLSVGVEFHGEDGSGACSYFLDITSPPPQ